MPKKKGEFQDFALLLEPLHVERDELIEKSEALAINIDGLASEAEGLSRSKADLVMSLAEVEVELAELRASNADELARSTRSLAETKLHLNGDTGAMAGQVAALAVDLQAGRDVRDEFARLETKVASKQELLSREQKKNAAAEALLEKNAFLVGMQLNECSESHLHALRSQLTRRASGAMAAKSKTAERDNKGITKTLEVTSDKVSKVLSSYDRTSTLLTKLRRERDFVEGNVHILNTKVADMRQRAKDYEAVVFETNLHIADLQRKLKQGHVKEEEEQERGSPGLDQSSKDLGSLGSDKEGAGLNPARKEEEAAREKVVAAKREALEAAQALMDDYKQMGQQMRRTARPRSEEEEEEEELRVDAPREAQDGRGEWKARLASESRSGAGCDGGTGGGGTRSVASGWHDAGDSSRRVSREGRGGVSAVFASEGNTKPGVLRHDGSEFEYEAEGRGLCGSGETPTQNTSDHDDDWDSFDYGHDGSDLSAIWRR